MLYDFTNQKSILTQYIAELRDVEIQKDQQRFRNNLKRIGNYLAYEISKKINYQKKTIHTPLAKTNAMCLKNNLVIATILRAGLPLHQGVLECFDQAENAFISAYRKHEIGKPIEYLIEYLSSPIIKNKTLIMTDPMLATGLSMIKCIEKLIEEKGMPSEIHVVGVIASKVGIKNIQKSFPQAHIWCSAIDKHLNDKQYIIPGLGDAGDLAYGIKKDKA